MGEEQAKKALDRLLKIESDFMPVFTGKFSLNYFLEIFRLLFSLYSTFDVSYIVLYAIFFISSDRRG